MACEFSSRWRQQTLTLRKLRHALSHQICSSNSGIALYLLMYIIILGGGVILMEVAHTLTVDGYIKANSENTKSLLPDGASGGSGGSVQIWTHNFTGTPRLISLL